MSSQVFLSSKTSLIGQLYQKDNIGTYIEGQNRIQALQDIKNYYRPMQFLGLSVY